MAGRNPNEAFQNYIKPMRDALQCVTRARLTLLEQETLATDTRYTVALNDMDPVALKGDLPIALSAGQIIRIVATDDARGSYTIETVEYFYDLKAGIRDEDRDILSFHWTPEGEGDGVVTYPHLHVGAVMLSKDAPILSRSFHKVHIPTSRVSLEAVIRLTRVQR